MPDNDRNDYAKRLTADQILIRIANAERRMRRCLNTEEMMTDMYAVQELRAALEIKEAA